VSSYKTSIEVNNTVETVFEAISRRLGDWWGNQDNAIDHEGIVFKVSWGEPWYQFEVVKYIQDQEMTWKCIDANQKIDGLPGVEKEWVGTEISWNFKSLDNDKCLLEFEHQGLVPELLCFKFCSSSWEHFLEDSLVKYLVSNNELDSSR
jgi:hypothetical protein